MILPASFACVPRKLRSTYAKTDPFPPPLGPRNRLDGQDHYDRPGAGFGVFGVVGQHEWLQRSRGAAGVVGSYTTWNLWKERNRRTFNGTRLTHLEIAALVFEGIKQWDLAFGGGHDSEGIR